MPGERTRWPYWATCSSWGPWPPPSTPAWATTWARRASTCLVAVGELARHIHDAAQAAGVPECYYCPTKAEARPVLDGVVRPHATILVKASRGMALEELVDYLLTITGEGIKGPPGVRPAAAGAGVPIGPSLSKQLCRFS